MSERSQREPLGGSARWGVRMVAILVSAVALVGACSSDDDSSDSAADTTDASTTTTTHPPATAPEAADVVENLVLEATELTDELLQDPSAVEDSDDPRLQRLEEIYTADSPTPPDVFARLTELADQDRSTRAAPSGVFREFVIYDIEAVDEDTMVFGFCANQDQETIDADGTVVEQFAEVTQGAGEARRIDGIWRFYGLHREQDRSRALTPGTATPGLCASLYPDEAP